MCSLQDERQSRRMQKLVRFSSAFCLASLLCFGGLILVVLHLPDRETWASCHSPQAGQTSHDDDEGVCTDQLVKEGFAVDELLGLAEMLERATLKDRKTVMVSPLNKAWAAQGSIFDLFLDGLKYGEGTAFMLDHLLVFALDRDAYDRCLQVHKYCVAFKTDGVDFSKEQLYMKADYIKMTKRKLMFLRLVLELGFDFFFSDIDVLWFRPPFQHFSKLADVNVACDLFKGRSTDLTNELNTGVMHARSNSRSKKLFNYWHQQQEAHPDLANQPAFDSMKTTPEFKLIGVKIRFMPTEFFAGFCRTSSSSSNMETVCSIHATCCKGLANKLTALTMAKQDWNTFKSMTPQESRELNIHFRKRLCLHKKTPWTRISRLRA